MAKKGFFKAIGTVFSGKDKPGQPPQAPPGTVLITPSDGPAQPPTETPPAKQTPHPEPQPAPKPKAGPTPETQVRELLAAVGRQQEQITPLLAGLSALAQRAEQVVASGKQQTGLAESMREILSQLRDGNVELARVLQEHAGEAQRQSDLLENIREKLAREGQSDLELAGALNRVAIVMDSAQKSSGAQGEAGEKVRDELTGVVEAIHTEFARQRKVTSWLLGGAVAAMSAILAALVALVYRVYTS